MNTQDLVYKQKVEQFEAFATLRSEESKLKQSQSYKMAYVWSLILPPTGVYYCIKYCFFANGSSEDVKAGVVCLALAILSFLCSVWLFNTMVGKPTGNETHMLNEMTVPANQKQLLQLLK